MGGISVIAWNSRGKIVGGMKCCSRCDAIEILEVSDVLEGLKLATEQGWQDVEVESDSNVVINQVRGGTPF